MPSDILPTEDPRTPVYAQRLKHRTGEGVKVRSKSEVVVAYALERVGLHPLYEVPLYAKSGDPTDFRLPDFTIMFEGETWYWEHLGMLSKPKYFADWQDKKAWYVANGYWGRVVTSEDGLDGSIQADTIEAIARPHSRAAVLNLVAIIGSQVRKAVESSWIAPAAEAV